MQVDAKLSSGLMLQRYLVGSYAYYILNETIMPDTEYDMLAKDLLKDWDTFTHRHKYLVNKEDLEAGTLYQLKEKDYPRIVKGCAIMLINKK